MNCCTSVQCPVLPYCLKASVALQAGAPTLLASLTSVDPVSIPATDLDIGA